MVLKKLIISYSIGYLDKVTKPFVLILSRMSDYVRHLKLKMKINIKTMNWSFGIDNQKLLKKHKVTCTKIEDLKNIELNAVLVYDDRYIRTEIDI